MARVSHLGRRRAQDHSDQAKVRDLAEYIQTVRIVFSERRYDCLDDSRYCTFQHAGQFRLETDGIELGRYGRAIEEVIARLATPNNLDTEIPIRVPRKAFIETLLKFHREFQDEAKYWYTLEMQETEVRVQDMKNRLLVEEAAASSSSVMLTRNEPRDPEMKSVMQRFSAENHVLRTDRRPFEIDRGQPLADNLARELEKLMRKQRSLEAVCSEEASEQYCSDCGGVRREEHIIGFCSSDIVHAYWCLGFSKMCI